LNLSCVQCHQPLPMTATFCNQCGRAVDADKDGVPDAIGRLIEAKARAIVAEEQSIRDEVAEREKAAATLKKLDEDHAQLQKQLEMNARLPRSFAGALFHVSFVTTIGVAMLWLVLGVLVHLFLFAVIDVSPAGLVLCPSHCEGCSGPGRVYAWHYKGPWRSENGRMGYALVCHNREIDIDKLSYEEVRGDKNVALQPYMISGVGAFFVEGLVLAPSIGLLVGIWLAGSRRRVYDAKRAALQAHVRANQAARAALSAPVADATTFRS